VGGEEVLITWSLKSLALRSLALKSLAAAPLLLALASALALAAPPGLARPERLSAGPSDQLLGVFGPGGRLFYVDNENGTLQIKSLDPKTGSAGLLLDDAADATWPRPSRDGRHLLYISHQTAAAGQLCVRDFDEKGSPGERRCLSGDTDAVYEADWLPDGQSIAALVRTELEGDYSLRRYPVGGGHSEPLLAASGKIASPAISPDGHWIAYVPIQRVSAQVGPAFASDAAPNLELRRLDRPDAAPLRVAFELPGVSGFPAFSVDGHFLYFTQFLNDTNLDGVIDGNDNGVLFRAPFDAGKDAPVDVARREQLTSAEWNCQYPAPAADRLVATCLFEGALHVYSLPLEGSVPANWTKEKIDDELSASRSRWETLLLLNRRVDLDSAAERPRTLLAMIELHLGLRELESAEFYARQIEKLAPGTPTAALTDVVLELVAYRRAEERLSRGQLSEQFITEARAQLKRLEALVQGGQPSAAALAKLVESEIFDTLGERAAAQAALASVALDQQTEPMVLRLAAERAADYRDAESRDELLNVYSKLSTLPALDDRERLHFADSYVDWLLRGRPRAQLGPLLDKAMAGVKPDSELGFRLELEQRLLGLDTKTQETVRARVFELYRGNKGFERRRALIDTTIRSAASADNDYLLYQFADTWVSGVDPQRAERRPAENLYRQVVLERAYIESARGDIADARGHFFGVTLQTDALDAHIGFVEQRFKEGHKEAEIAAEYQQRFARKADDPVYQFVQAWLLARSLVSNPAPAAQAKASDEAVTLLRSAARTLWSRVELQQLWGYVAHQAFLRTGQPLSAQEATSHYQLALDLAHESPRARAALLEDLGLVEAAVGNHAIAIGYFVERDKLPWISPGSELNHRLEKARTLMHLDHMPNALLEIDAAVTLVEAHPELARFRPMVLDRAALYHLDAKDYPRSRELYTTLLPLIDAAPASAEKAHNRFTARLGRASAWVAEGHPVEALADLDAIAPMIDDPQVAPPKSQPAYHLMVDGLRARAHAQQGEWDAAIALMTARRDRLAARVAVTRRDEDNLDIAFAEVQLADWSWRKKDAAAAVAHLQAAFDHADAWTKSTATPIHPFGLQLLDTAARLHLDLGLPLAGSHIDLVGRLQTAQALMSKLRNPDWTAKRALFTAHLTRLRLEDVN
jgi:hypothetical protein